MTENAVVRKAINFTHMTATTSRYIYERFHYLLIAFAPLAKDNAPASKSQQLLAVQYSYSHQPAPVHRFVATFFSFKHTENPLVLLPL